MYKIVLMKNNKFVSVIKNYVKKKHAINFINKIDNKKVFCEKKYEYENKKLKKIVKELVLISNNDNCSEFIKKIKFREEELFKNNIFINRVDFKTIVNLFFDTKIFLEIIIINNKVIIYGNKKPYIISCKNIDTAHLLYNKLKEYFLNQKNFLFFGSFNKKNKKRIYSFLEEKYGIKKGFLYRKNSR